jgi:galactitol PTS system EIIA component
MGEDSLQFSDLVRPELILDQLRAVDRDDALRQMAQYLVDTGHCRPSFVEAIIERERNHPSALPMPGHKIAIPHTDAEHVEKSAILLARLEAPVEFRSMGSPDDVLQVRMISMFALKEKKRIGDLLETLINVYQHNEILDDILRAPEANTMFRILRQSVETYGEVT